MCTLGCARGVSLCASGCAQRSYHYAQHARYHRDYPREDPPAIQSFYSFTRGERSILARRSVTFLRRKEVSRRLSVSHPWYISVLSPGCCSVPLVGATLTPGAADVQVWYTRDGGERHIQGGVYLHIQEWWVYRLKV